MVNLVITRDIPLAWNKGRPLCGATTIYEGYHLSVVALRNASPNRVPLLALNTVTHELLHILPGDIFARRRGYLNGAEREAALEWQATPLWLAGKSSGVRHAAESYVQRLRKQPHSN
jgi:hypothetical protein